MLPMYRRAFAVAVIALLVSTTHAVAQQPSLSGAALAAELQRGGYVLMFRHAATDWSSRDESRSQLDDCSTQRNLSEGGRADARRIGEAIRALRISIGDVWASPFCRTRETAQLAFNRTELTRELMWPGSRASQPVMAEHRAKVDARLGTVPAAGQNTVLVTHGFVVHAATEINLAEGEAVILRPEGGRKFTVVARVLPDGWAGLSTSGR